jgi:hypothetical protein
MPRQRMRQSAWRETSSNITSEKIGVNQWQASGGEKWWAGVS